ncbi:MAG: serine hydrolase domain-containing protein [Myxococcota bacterium]
MRGAKTRAASARLLIALAVASATWACDGGEGADVFHADTITFFDVVPDAAPEAGPDLPADAVPETGPAHPDALADTAESGLEPALQIALEAAVDAEFAAVEAPGVQVTVVVPGQGRWSRDQGLADADLGLALVPGDRFRVGSVTKTFVTALILQRVEEGTLALDDPADQWLTGFDFGAGITLERLLNHTSGLFNYTDDANFLGKSTAPATPTEIIAWARAHGDVFAPGADWSYSNTGFYVLGLAVEAVAGEPLAEVLRSRLLAPQGLGDTFFESFEPMPGGRVTGHALGSPVEGLLDMSWAWAAGGMVSNGDDLCRWAEALYRGDVLSPASRAALVAPAALPGGKFAAYGLGSYLDTRGGVSVVGHTGSTMGFRGEVFIHLASGTCVAVLSNDFFATTRPMAQAVWSALNASLALNP